MTTQDYTKRILSTVKHDIREYERGKYDAISMKAICISLLARLYTLAEISKCTDVTKRLPIYEIYHLEEEVERIQNNLQERSA